MIISLTGECESNTDRKFTGWIDSDLSQRGIREVEHAARLLLERGHKIDVSYTSILKRSIRSTWIIMKELDQIYRPIIKTWRLNERM
jgi:2,3-bisphosphoglycerate-dependent phosphoglycerate mutase